jgi:16S rRNA (guanine1516-N2)-methyltransferase
VIHGKSRRPWVLDLSEIDTRQGAGNLSRKQPLPSAIGRSALRVVDATAGFGHDAAMLACMGYDVEAWERSPLVHAILVDAVTRATGDVGRLLSEHLTIHHGDTTTVLSTMSPPPEVVFLDPMYPPAPKQSPLPKKPIQILRAIVGPDQDALTLLKAARSVATNRVVVKRPTWAPPVMDDCAHSHGGKLARYDVFVPL